MPWYCWKCWYDTDMVSNIKAWSFFLKNTQKHSNLPWGHIINTDSQYEQVNDGRDSWLYNVDLAVSVLSCRIKSKKKNFSIKLVDFRFQCEQHWQISQNIINTDTSNPETKIMFITSFTTTVWKTMTIIPHYHWPTVCWFPLFSCVNVHLKSVKNCNILSSSSSFNPAGEGQNWLICPPTCRFSELSFYQNHMHTVGGIQ